MRGRHWGLPIEGDTLRCKRHFYQKWMVERIIGSRVGPDGREYPVYRLRRVRLKKSPPAHPKTPWDRYECGNSDIVWGYFIWENYEPEA